MPIGAIIAAPRGAIRHNGHHLPPLHCSGDLRLCDSAPFLTILLLTADLALRGKDLVVSLPLLRTQKKVKTGRGLGGRLGYRSDRDCAGLPRGCAWPASFLRFLTFVSRSSFPNLHLVHTSRYLTVWRLQQTSLSPGSSRHLRAVSVLYSRCVVEQHHHHHHHGAQNPRIGRPDNYLPTYASASAQWPRTPVACTFRCEPLVKMLSRHGLLSDPNRSAVLRRAASSRVAKY